MKFPADIPVFVEVIYCFSSSGTNDIYNRNKPDIDNLTKFVFDSLTGIIFHDDAQVVKLVASKIYCENANKIKISISKIQGDVINIV